jgi:hypothetical protein
MVDLSNGRKQCRYKSEWLTNVMYEYVETIRKGERGEKKGNSLDESVRLRVHTMHVPHARTRRKSSDHDPTSYII